MTKLLIKAIRFLPILIIVVVVNYIGDTANLFNNYDKKIADAMLSGKNVYDIGNCDERLVQKSYITSCSKAYDLVYIGASHFMQLSGLKSGDSFFNSGVSGATLYDIMGIVSLYNDNNILPKGFIIEVSSLLFDKNYMEVDQRYKSIKHQSDRLLRLMGYGSIISNMNMLDPQYSELVSPSYFRESISTLIHSKHRNQILTLTDLNEGVEPIKRRDGSIAYSEQFRNVSTADVDKGFTPYINGGLSHISKNYRMDTELTNQFESLIEFLQKNKIEVIFVMSPYAPEVYDYVSHSEEFSRVQDVETYALKLANAKKIPVYGSLDPYIVGCTNNDYLDSSHLRSASLEKVFSCKRSAASPREELSLIFFPF